MKKVIIPIFLLCLSSFSLKAQQNEKLRSDFANPPLDHRMNINQHDLPKTQIALTDLFDITLPRSGYGGMTLNVAKTDYLDSQTNFDWFVSGTKAAKAKGYDLWLYDEKYYPSGMADTKVLDDHPEWETEGLLIFKKSATSAQVITIAMPGTLILAKAIPYINSTVEYDNAIDISSSFSNGNFSWTAPTGDWRVVVVTKDVLYEGYQAATDRAGVKPHYPSLLMPEVTELFINYTHERYAQNFGEKLGNYFTATFTDEPSSMALPYNQLGYGVYPWKQIVSDKIQEKYGYDLTDKLLEIAWDRGNEGQQLRYQYFKTISELMSQNYFKKLKDFCHRHDFLSSGHLLLEESIVAHTPLYGSVMDCFREMDIPGVDCLTGLVYKTKSYMFSSRLAASTAELKGNSRVMFESCPIDNDRANMEEPPALDVKGVHNRMMVGGVTDYNNYLKLSHENFAGKKAFNDYMARVVTMLSGGARASRIAVYYPIETVWAKYRPNDMRLDGWWKVQGADPEAQAVENSLLDLTYGLLDNGWEFSYIDALGLEEAVVKNDTLTHGSELKWNVLILPSVEVLPRHAYEKVVEFVNNGGKVIALRKLPENSETEFPATDITNKFVEFSTNGKIKYNTSSDAAILNTQLESMIGRDIVLSSYKEIMHSHKKIDGEDVYFIINDRRGENTITITLPNDKKWELWNPQTGEITTVTSSFTWKFDAYDGIILRTAGLSSAVHLPQPSTMSIYPNPATQTITVEGVEGEITKAMIYSTQGQLVKEFLSPLATYPINDLAVGNYLLSISTNKNSYNQILIKQ